MIFHTYIGDKNKSQVVANAFNPETVCGFVLNDTSVPAQYNTYWIDTQEMGYKEISEILIPICENSDKDFIVIHTNYNAEEVINFRTELINIDNMYNIDKICIIMYNREDEKNV